MDQVSQVFPFHTEGEEDFPHPPKKNTVTYCYDVTLLMSVSVTHNILSWGRKINRGLPFHTLSEELTWTVQFGRKVVISKKKTITVAEHWHLTNKSTFYWFLSNDATQAMVTTYRNISNILPSCSSLLSLVAEGSSWMPRPKRSVTSCCLKEITVGFTGFGTLADCKSSSERSDRSSSLAGNVLWG